MTDIHSTRLRVQENTMHCTSCENRIKSILITLSGVLAVETSQTTQEVIVSYDSNQLGLEEIIELLEKMGFPASPVSQV